MTFSKDDPIKYLSAINIFLYVSGLFNIHDIHLRKSVNEFKIHFMFYITNVVVFVRTMCQIFSTPY